MRDFRRRAFTLIELLSVIALLALLSAVAAPALAAMDRMRSTALRDAVHQTLLHTRAVAMASGRPTGVRFDLTDQRAAVLTITAPGAAITAVSTAPYADGVPLAYSAGIALASHTIAAGDNATLWFDYKGVPHTRETDGSAPDPITSDVVLTFLDGNTITCTPVTGHLQ